MTSNAEELEILPSDTTWEAAELARGVGMIESETGKPAHDKGCDIVGSLGTVAAALEMARLYALRGECEEIGRAIV